MTQPTHPIKIAFFDIDDTLYYKAAQIIPASVTEKVLPALKAQGIIPAIATGRCYGAFPDALKPLVEAGQFEFFVTINGQHNRYQDQLISHYPLSKERIEQVIAGLKSLGIAYAFVCNDEIAVSEITPQIDEALKPIKADYICDPLYYQAHTVIQMLAFYSQEENEKVLASGLLGDDLKEVRWHAYSVDILNKHNSKARGIADVLAHFGWGPEDAVAFGDGLNDIEMMQGVGLSVAMGNADEKVKALASMVTDPVWEDGIYTACKRLGIC
ncbi:hydrolase [Pasteurellaceae bacterium RH1A]|nr:hydrolase [Pasteurellaceae bacterium RH1A]